MGKRESNHSMYTCLAGVGGDLLRVIESGLPLLVHKVGVHVDQYGQDNVVGPDVCAYHIP
jgi:hypothetical protein